jgi:sigma-E factor negative regulatory protein RseA
MLSAEPVNRSQDQLEAMSAFLDGETPHGQQAVPWLGRETDAEHGAHLQTWQSYHCIGEVMRAEPTLGQTSSTEFLERWRKTLAAEPDLHGGSSAGVALGRPPASNQPMWRWVAGFAALAVTAVVGWQVSAGMIRNPEVDALLAQHRQHGGMSALQAPVGFLRTATYGQGD